MKSESRFSFTLRQRKWFLKRDGKKCNAPFPHKCDDSVPLQVHHIKPHGYLRRVAPKVSADYPENAITLCRNAHECIHPDVVVARNNYHLDKEVFYKLRDQRNFLMDNRKIYWVDTWDRLMEVVALVNTRKYEVKHKFPVYNRRVKHEITKNFEESETEGL